MSKNSERRGIQWYLKALATCAVVSCLLAAAWICLPEIAAFGLRYEPTRPCSKKLLFLLGSRAFAEIVQQHKYIDGEWSGEWREWWANVSSIVERAEADCRGRKALARSADGLGAFGPHNQTVLHVASAGGCSHLAKMLLERGADADASDRDGVSPLHYAAAAGHEETASLLIDHSACLNSRDGHGRTPLHLTAWRGRMEVIELLVAKGADLNIVDREGYSPLDLAVQGNHHDIADLLRRHGAKTAKELEGTASPDRLSEP